MFHFQLILIHVKVDFEKVNNQNLKAGFKVDFGKVNNKNLKASF